MPTNYSNIPQELRDLDQWLLWRADKTPVNSSGFPIDPTEPNNWLSFEKAVQLSDNFAGIGFAFKEGGPYVGIDLDNPYKLKPSGEYAYVDPARELERVNEVFDAFPSYSEKSPSGNGCHIIVKGYIPSNAKPTVTPIEIYNKQRYFTFTGEVLANRFNIIEADKEILAELHEKLKVRETVRATCNNGRNEPQRQSDEEIIAIAEGCNANFRPLFNGDLLNHNSHSECDVHLVNIIGHLTQNRAQIHRIYRMSWLGQRPKKLNRDDLVEQWIDMAFDQLPPVVDPAMFKVFADAWEQSGTAQADGDTRTAPESAAVGNSALPIPIAHGNYKRPPGMMGEITDYIYAASQRPMMEIALSGAISLMAGLCGQQYNIGDSGLNYYLVCVAPASIGKEGARSGIRKLLRAANLHQSPNGPSALNHLGPGAIQSGQALFNYMDHSKNTCFLTIQGEFGIKMQIMNHPNANGAIKGLKDLYLDLYHQSHKGGMLNKSIYADTEKSTDDIYSPALSIFGESTGEEFYKACNNNLVLSGFLTRFSIIEYSGLRVPRNENAHKAVVPLSLAQRIYQLVSMNVTKRDTNGPTMLEYEADAQQAMNAWDTYCDDAYNASDRDAVRAMWGRAHIKAERLAGLVAVGLNQHTPIISLQCVEWAIDFIKRDIGLFAKIVEEGRLGHSGEQSKDDLAAEELVKVIARYLSEPFPSKPNPSEKPNEHKIGVVRPSGIQPKVTKNGLFKDRDNKVVKGLGEAFKALEESEILIKYNPTEDQTRALRYQVADADYFRKVYAKMLKDNF